MHPKLKWLLRLVLGLIILAAVMRHVDWTAARQALSISKLRYGWLVLLPVAGTLRGVLMSYKWALLLRVHRVHLSTWEAVRLYYIGYLAGSVTPGALGADAYRVAALARAGRPDAVAASVIVEKIIGLAVMAGLAAAGAPHWLRSVPPPARTPLIYLTLATLLAFLVATLLTAAPGLWKRLLWWLRVPSFFQRLSRAVGAYRHHPWTLATFFLLTCLEAAVLIGLAYCGGRALGLPVAYTVLLWHLPIVYLAIRLPISVQGLGIQEGLFAMVFEWAGATYEGGLLTSLLLRVAEVLFVLAPAAMLAWRQTSILVEPRAPDGPPSL